MSFSGPTLAHPASGSTARTERELIRAHLLESRPELDRRLQVGPSGALLIPLPTGRSIEIGRMRRRGVVRWVVVLPSADGASLREPTTLGDVVDIVLGALDLATLRR